MPSMASITVKRSDGATDIVYDAVAASGGDNSPAVWRQDTGIGVTIPVGLRSTFQMQSAWNGPRTARVITLKFVGPYIYESPTNVWNNPHRTLGEARFVVPVGIPQGSLLEHTYQSANLIGSLLVKQCLGAGYAPT